MFHPFKTIALATSLLTFSLFSGSTPLAAQSTDQLLTPRTFIDVSKKVLPAVVSIQVENLPSKELMERYDVETFEELQRKLQQNNDLDAFADRFLLRAAPEDLAAFAPSALKSLAAYFRAAGLMRTPGEPFLRVFTPGTMTDGWTLGTSLLATINDDRPFLVDSIVGALKEMGIRILAIFHPIIKTKRDAAGRTIGYLTDKDASGTAESMIAIAIAPVAESRAAEIEAEIARVLRDVTVAVNDWQAMLMRLSESVAELRMRRPRAAPPEEVEESLTFLEWLQSNHFTFLGCRDYVFESEGEGRLVSQKETGLGLLRDPERRVIRRGADRVSLTPEVRGFLMQPSPLIITKANVRSTVHRRVLQDYIGIKRFDASGALVGERRFVGLFTSAAYNESAHQIPFIRRKVMSVEARANLPRSSHDAKALAQVIETYPRDELFQIAEDDLFRIAMGRVYLGNRPRTKAFLRFDTFDRFVSALIYVPSDVFRNRLTREFGDILSRMFGGKISAQSAQSEEGQLTRVHLIIDLDGGERPAFSETALQTRLDAAGRTISIACCRRSTRTSIPTLFLAAMPTLSARATARPSPWRRLWRTSAALRCCCRTMSLAGLWSTRRARSKTRHKSFSSRSTARPQPLH